MPRSRHWLRRAILCAALAGVAGCAATGSQLARQPRAEVGLASYYADKFHHRSTASGETYDRDQLTAAHPSLPFGTRVRVTNLENGRSVVVRINDRGPFKRGRVIDVSYRAARRLGFLRAGLAKVKVQPLGG